MGYEVTDWEPPEVWREAIRKEWIDYNGHMNVAYYTLILDHAADALYERIGLGPDYLEHSNCSTFAVEAHITYDRELMEGDEAFCTGRVVGFDEKRIHHYYEMYHGTEGFLASTGEFMTLHVDLSTRKVSPWPDDLRQAISGMYEQQAGLAVPKPVGRALGIPVKP